jgi:hypothetical protein
MSDLLKQPHHIPRGGHGDLHGLIWLAVGVLAFGLRGLRLLRGHGYDANASRPRRAAVQPPPLQEPLATVKLLEGQLYPAGHGGPADAVYRRPVVSGMMRLSAQIGFDSQALRRAFANYPLCARLMDGLGWSGCPAGRRDEENGLQRSSRRLVGTSIELTAASYIGSGNGGSHDTTGGGVR